MKNRNKDSKAFHKNSGGAIIKKELSIQNLVHQLQQHSETSSLSNSRADSRPSSSNSSILKSYTKIIAACHNNLQAQKELCQVLTLPFVKGPLSLSSIPSSFFDEEYLSSNNHERNSLEFLEKDLIQEQQTPQNQEVVMGQLAFLMDFLKKRASGLFFCWIIYYNEELKILTCKMMKKHEWQENSQNVNCEVCMVGIFIGFTDSTDQVDKEKNPMESKLQNNKVKKIITEDNDGKEQNPKAQKTVTKPSKLTNKVASMSYCVQTAKSSHTTLVMKNTRGKNMLKGGSLKVFNSSTNSIKQKQSESVLSIKSQKSCSKTNSSSFQKDFFKSKKQKCSQAAKEFKNLNFKKKNQLNKVAYIDCTENTCDVESNNKIRKSLSNNKFDRKRLQRLYKSQQFNLDNFERSEKIGLLSLKKSQKPYLPNQFRKKKKQSLLMRSKSQGNTNFLQQLIKSPKLQKEKNLSIFDLKPKHPDFLSKTLKSTQNQKGKQKYEIQAACNKSQQQIKLRGRKLSKKI